MKMNIKLIAAVCALSPVFFACQKTNDSKQVQTIAGIPNEVVSQIEANGFSTDGMFAVSGGYVVENDIFLSSASLSKMKQGVVLNVGNEEQYRTTNLVTGLPRVITVSMSYPSNKTLFTAATDSAIARYNALNLRLKFVRIPSGGEIDIVGADLGTSPFGTILGQSSGFPDDNGNPASPITLNSHKGTYSANTDVKWLATIIAHEMGHTIGMRHTDYKNRYYSCGIPTNEGQAGVGAIYIPGTEKSAKDPGSWMLACTDGTDRPFNPNDKIALNYLYK